MKTYFILIAIALFANSTLKAQKSGDIIVAMFEPSNTLYYARVLSSENNILSVNFVHSNSAYKISKGIWSKFVKNNTINNYKSEVISNSGGKYESGTVVYYSIASPIGEIGKENSCDSEGAILEFKDGKRFLAGVEKIEGPNYTFNVAHSQKEYIININTKEILKSDGSYPKGEFLRKILCTDYMANLNNENSEE